MTPVPKEQNTSEELIKEFIKNGGRIKQIPFGETSGVTYKSSFYGSRNKKAEQATEKKND